MALLSVLTQSIEILRVSGSSSISLIDSFEYSTPRGFVFFGSFLKDIRLSS